MYQPKKVKASSVVLQDFLLGGEAVNTGAQCGVAGAELDLFQDQQEVQGHPPLGEDRQVPAHHLTLPHQMVLGMGFRFHDTGMEGRHLKIGRTEGRGKVGHHSVQTACSIPLDSGMRSTAAGGHGAMATEGVCS